MWVDGDTVQPEGDGMEGTAVFGNAPPDPLTFPRSIDSPDERTMSATKVALNVPFDYLFQHQMLGGVDEQDIFDIGEDEIADRIASGMSAAEARGTAFEVQLPMVR